jgi:signal transduction histidine kinase
VSDDGQGFEPAKVAGGGFGLRTLRERAAELGGTLAVTSAPGQGATVRLEFPETS